MTGMERYQLNSAKMFYDMADGQAIVINFDTGMYFGMSSLGSAVLDAAVNGASAGEILAALAKLENCPGDMESRLEKFLCALTEKEIIKEAGQAGEADVSGGSLAFPEGALEEGFALTVNEYAEAQDLILADPVHDVDVNMGWPIMKQP